MAEITGPIPPYVTRARAFSNVQPFTYPDGLTFLEILERMRDYIENTLVPFIRDGLDEFADEVIAELQARLDIVIQLVADATELVNQAEQLRDDVQAIKNQIDEIYNHIQILYTQIQQNAERAENAADRAEQIMQRFIFPDDFGAVGDGVTDDTEAWNAFIAADTGIHFVSPGNYLVNGEVKRFVIGVIGNGEYVDLGSAWDQPRGDHERHSILVHRNDIDANVEPVSPVIKTQTHVNWEVDNPQPASFKHVIGGYHEGILDGFYNIQTDTNQNFTVFGSTGKNNMAGLYGMLAGLFYIEDAHETDNPLIASLGGTKNGGTFTRFTRRAQYQSGGYMFGHEIYAMNVANELEDIPYTNNNEFAFNSWTAGIKIGAFSSGAPISAAMFTHGSSTSKHGFWNGIVVGGSGFRINGVAEGAPGTVGINMASWRPGAGYADVGIRMRRANRHLYFAEGAKIRSSHTRFNHELGSAGISLEAAAGSVPYFNFREGATGDPDGGSVTDLGVIDAGPNRLRQRSVGELHFEATSGAAIYVMNSARLAPATANDGQLDLGSGTRRWNNIYATNATISTSDERHKDEITDIPDAVLDAWGDVQYLQYRMLDAVEAKGPDARLHTGVVAQRIMKAFSDRGLNAANYGLLCYDAWPAEEEKVTEYEYEVTPAVYEQVLVKEAEYEEHENEDGTIETREVTPPEYADGKLITPAVTETRRDVIPAVEAGDRYGVRYEEALALEAAYGRREQARMLARIEALEARL